MSEKEVSNDIRVLQEHDDLTGLVTLSREFFQEYEAHYPDFFGIEELRDQDITGYFSRFIDSDKAKAFIASRFTPLLSVKLTDDQTPDSTGIY